MLLVTTTLSRPAWGWPGSPTCTTSSVGRPSKRNVLPETRVVPCTTVSPSSSMTELRSSPPYTSTVALMNVLSMMVASRAVPSVLPMLTPTLKSVMRLRAIRLFQMPDPELPIATPIFGLPVTLVPMNTLSVSTPRRDPISTACGEPVTTLREAVQSAPFRFRAEVEVGDAGPPLPQGPMMLSTTSHRMLFTPPPMM